MANRRHSGPNRSFSGSSMSVNPWQGGAPPTVGGISQLTDTQAQLALALTNLLRPPTLPSSQQLPSLLNLPQINPGASYNYQRHNYDRTNRSNSNRRGRFGDNKMQNRPSRDRRRNEQRKSDSRNSDSNKNNQKDSERSLSKSRESEIKKDSDVSKTDNQSEEQEDKKRDWKEEKNNGECDDLDKTQDEDKEKTEDNENKDKETEKENKEKDEKGNDEEKKDEKKRNKDGRYAGIPVQYLKCLICEKSMWDGESFEKHLRGRAHQQMCESLEDSYKIQADMMRQSIRLAEERKAIELNRMKRHGKRVDLRKVSHCNMCNFDFYGREAEHRRSEGHKKLKRFLHPRCKRCRIEFPTKIEWEEHRLTPEHIRKTMEIIENMGDAASIEVDSSDDIIDLNLDDDDDDDNDPENVILEIDDNTDLLTNFDSRIPQYRKNRVVGSSSISEVTGHLCKLCDRFFINEQRAQAHGRTKQHYDKFIALLKEKHAEKTKAEENKSKKHSIEDNTEDDEGNWKRRKISAEQDGDETQKEETSEIRKEDLYDPMEAEEEAEAEEKQQQEEEEKLKNEAKKEEKIENGTVEEPEKKPEAKVEDEKEKETPKEEPAPVKQEPETPQRGTRNARGRPRPGPASKTRGRNN